MNEVRLGVVDALFAVAVAAVLAAVLVAAVLAAVVLAAVVLAAAVLVPFDSLFDVLRVAFPLASPT